MKPTAAALLAVLLLASAALVLVAQHPLDPLAPYRAPDGSLHIPGNALTPELQRLLFGGNDLQSEYNLTFLVPERSPYPTLHSIPVYVEVPNLNVFVHPSQRPVTWGDALGRLAREWFPPVDWNQVGMSIQAFVQRGLGWFLGLFTWNARAVSVSVDTTTVTVSGYVNTCTTTQTASAGDNAILVMLSERGNYAYATVTYGSVSLTLIPNTAVSNGTNARTEMWFFQGTIPAGSQTMTATLSGGNTQRQVCATILLSGVASVSPTTGGTAATGGTANPSIAISPAAGELAFTVLANQNGTSPGISPTAVTGTGATATSLYGIAPTLCTGAFGTYLCGAGADLPNPGTAITWTQAAATWAISAVRVVPANNCGTGGGNCYRIGTGGAWSNTANWSATSGGPSCGCTPAATDNVIFNATPTGTTTLAANTTVASIDMTGFTGTLDTGAGSDWALTVNGPFDIQGTLLARNSVVTVTGPVTILTAGSVVNLGGSAWTVIGRWTNSSTSAAWVAGTSTVTIREAASDTPTFAALTGPTNEFNNLLLDTSAVGGITYTMSTNALYCGGLLTIRNSTGGATGNTILDTSASNLTLTVGALALGTFGQVNSRSSTVMVNGSVSVGAANAFVTNPGGSWTVGGSWTNLTASSSWSFAASMRFLSSGGQTMTFKASATEFGGNVTFDTTVAAGVTYTMASNALTLSGLLTVQNTTGGATGNTILTTSAANLGITAGSIVIATRGTLIANGSTINVGGNWTVTAANATFTAGSSTVAFTTTAAVNMTQPFANLTVSAGTVTLAANTTVSATLTVSGGTLAKSTFTLSAATLTLSGGALTSTSGNGTVTGNVSISSAGSYFVFGSETWAIGGSWTNASASASWNAGTGTVVFNASASRVMTFGALPVVEFNNVQVSPTAAATFTMATNGLRWNGAFALNSNATLSTANLSLNGGNLVVNNGATLSAGSSSVAVGDVTMAGGASGTIILTAGSWTVTGSWNTSGAGSTFTKGTSTVTLAGAAKTVAILNPANGFYRLTVSGTIAQNSAIDVTNTLSITGTLTTSNNNITGGSSLTVAATGTLSAGSSSITIGSMNTSAAGATFAVGTSTIIVGLSGGTINIPQVLFNFTVNASVATTVASNLTWSGTLTLTSSTPTFNGNFTSSGTAANTLFGSATMTIAGNWDTSSVTSGAFSSTASTLTFTGAARTIRIAGSQSFATVAVSGTISQLSQLTATGSLTIATGSSLATSSNPLTVQGGLTVNGTGSLATGTSTVLVGGNVNIATATAFVTSGAGSWTVSGSWTNNSTSASWSFLAATTFNASAPQTITLANLAPEFGGSLTFNSGASTTTFTMSTHALRWAGTLTIQGGAGSTTLATADLGMAGGTLVIGNGGVLTANASTVTVSGVTMTGGASGILTVTTGAWTIAGSWNTAGAGSSWSAGSTSTYTFSATGTLATLAGQSTFPALAVSGGTVTLANNLSVSRALTLTGGVLAKGANTLSASSLAMSGGSLTSTSGDVTIGGNVDITSPSSYIALGSETWTVAGTWTNASTSAAWSAGTGIVVFTSGSGGTMTFAALPGGVPEFNNVTFNAGASSAAFAMAARALVWTGTLTVQGGSGTTTLDTGNLGLEGGALTIGNSGFLNAGASTAVVSTVSMVGGTSGTLTLTSGTWTVSGNWDSSGTGAALASGTSTVTFTGASATIHLGTGQQFCNLTIGGTISLASAVTASATLAVSNGAVLTMTGQSIAFNGLVENGSGSIVDGGVVVVNLMVANSDPTNVTTVSVFSIWTVGTEYSWTHTSTVGTSTITFTIGGNTSGDRFNVTKDGNGFTTGNVDASGQVVFTMLGSDPTIDVLVLSACGSGRYWVGGTGTWSQTNHWASASGGVGGCAIPTSADTAFIDANAGGGTITVDQDVTVAALDTTGWTGTIAIGTFGLALTGNLVLAGGAFTIGDSTGVGLSVGGSLTVSGSAVLDGSAGASVVTVGGNASITSTTAYMRMGTGTWTFRGSWSNASTSTNWGAGTGTVVFDSANSVTMTFGGFAGKEFNDVTFASTAGTAVTFTMGANSLRWSGTLRIQDTAGSTTTLDTAGRALAGGSLVVGNSGVLIANASTVTASDVTMTGGTSGAIVLTTGSWTVAGNWNTSGAGAAFTRGTSTVTLSGTGRTLTTLNAANGFYDLTVSGTLTQSSAVDVTGTLVVTGTLTTAGNAISGGADLVISGGGALLGTSASIAVSGVTMNDASPNTFSLTSGSMTVSGSWDTSGASSSFLSGTSTFTLSAISGTIALGAGQSFATLILSGGFAVTTQLSASSLTISAGLLAKGNHPLTLTGDLTLSGGSLSSVSGDVAIAGRVTISAIDSFIAFGSETWTIGGAWTNASTSSSWSPGAATVVFDSSTPCTMTFAGANLPVPELNAVVFNSGASTVTYTLAGFGLHAQAVTIQGGSGTTTVDTSDSDLPITVDALTVGAGGGLLANGSTLTIRALDTNGGSFAAGTSTVVVNASGGTLRIPQVLHSLVVNAGISTVFASSLQWSADLILTGATVAIGGNLTASGAAALSFGAASIAVTGSWDTSTATTFISGGSSVTFTGSGQTIALGPGQGFATLVIAGSVAIASDLNAATLTVNAGGLLTKTNRALVFNDLTVSGTIADGSVNVSNLTVSASDAAALVTVSAFTAWNVGSDYAWTHTSSDATVTLTWTLGGNTPGFLYRVAKNGSSFADGTVDGSGNVVFTMQGSDPDMHVSVLPPAISNWWQSPYFLAALPLPFIVVIAMFAQRRRWRPTKAFLVDERGQMLREFTLDPSCKVTYEQALQAGALDAVDRDVRVSKYRARAVHGDLLSLIMLAIGPADVEEVEFARGILASIQDTFDDRVRERVEEARAEEASLEAAREQAQAERADLQVRSRVFGDAVNAFTIAQGKMDAESRALHAQTEDLVSRERTLTEERQSLESETKRLEEARKSADQVTTQLEARKGELASWEEAINAREAQLVPKEQDLAARGDALAAKEKEQAEREGVLTAAETKLTADLETYHLDAQALRRLEAELAEERKALDELTVQLHAQQTDLDARAAEAEAREKQMGADREALEGELAEFRPREQQLTQRESDLAAQQSALEVRVKALADEEARLTALATDLRTREAGVADREGELAEERKTLEERARQTEEARGALDAETSALHTREIAVAKQSQDLADLKANLGPREAALLGKETDLEVREKALADERSAFERQQDLVAAKALEIQQQMEAIREQEDGIQREKLILQDAKGAFEAQHKELEGKVTAFEQEVKGREGELTERERTLGEARMRLTKDREDFDAKMAEKNQWIASKEIELEAKEQGLSDRESEIRAQAAENAQHLSELAAREENLEIEAARQDKALAELEARKAELGAMARDVEARTAKLREDEARKAEELRTWQATLESEQALLREQKETFDKEMKEVKESWAGRMLRVEQHEAELKEREAKVQADTEWVARNESAIGEREKRATENLKVADDLKAGAERLRADLEQRTLEIESRERSLREEAASRSIELEKRTEALEAAETELAGRKAQWETELTTQTEKLKARGAELSGREDALAGREADLAARENTLTKSQDTLRGEEERIERERVDMQMTEKRLEAGQLELSQAREKQETETVRFQAEADAARQSLAAKEADLRSERERLERESASLQDKLGSKAKELASREKATAAREDELRAEEHDLETRVRELESRERQTEARFAEITARQAALAQSEEESKARRALFDETVQKFEADAAARQREWKDLQTTLKSQEQQLAADTETRHTEIRKRMEELEQQEHSLNAQQTQAQIERARLEAQAKAQAAKEADLDAAAARADKRFAELKSIEEELLKARQAFESERTGWSARRSEELKQLEATRDAAADQAQQAERLVEESQRRVYVAAEAEKAAKRQAEELAAAQAELDQRRTVAEQAEKDLEAQTAQLRDASQRLATKEVELGTRARELSALQERLATLEKKNNDASQELGQRKATLDLESERIAALAAQLDRRQAEDETRRAGTESKLADLANREQILTTELQRADNLMEDLNRKEVEIALREKDFAAKEGSLSEREAVLAQRNAELMEGMQAFERMRKEHEARVQEVDEHHRVAARARKEAEAIESEAQRMKAQAETMQAEVAKNMRFLQKKALDVLDREERIRARENRTEESDRVLGARGQVLDEKERALETERVEIVARLEKAKQENEKLKARLAEAEKAGPSTVEVDDWKRDIENRVKIIQKKALDLLDREERLRKKEEELKAMAAQLGVASSQ